MSRASSGFFFFRIKVFPVNWYGSSLHHLTTELEIRSCSPIWLLIGPLRAGVGSIIYSFRCLSYCQWQSQDAQLCFYCGVNLQLTVTASSQSICFNGSQQPHKHNYPNSDCVGVLNSAMCSTLWHTQQRMQTCTHSHVRLICQVCPTLAITCSLISLQVKVHAPAETCFSWQTLHIKYIDISICLTS